jgi:hypothetical protein
MKYSRHHKGKGILILEDDNIQKEREFELNYLLSLSLNQRFFMMEAKSRELKSLLSENGHRETYTIIKRK